MASTARHAGMRESEGAGGSSTSLNSARLSLIPPFLAAIRGLMSACLSSGGVIRRRFLTARPFAEEEPRRHDETGKMRTRGGTDLNLTPAQLQASVEGQRSQTLVL